MTPIVINAPGIERFFENYLEAVRFSGDFQDVEFSEKAVDVAVAECILFVRRTEHLADYTDSGVASRAGQDFWLTRNGHGAGFWDGGWPENGDALTAWSRSFGECCAYVGDDGLVHFS